MPPRSRFSELSEFLMDLPSASVEVAKKARHRRNWLLFVVLLAIAQPAAAGPNNAIDCNDPRGDNEMLACINQAATLGRAKADLFVQKHLRSNKEFALFNLTQAALSPNPKSRQLAQSWLLKTRHLNRNGVMALPKWKKLVDIIKQTLHGATSRRSSHKAHAKSYPAELAATCRVEKQTTRRDVTLKCVSRRCIGQCLTETTTVRFVTGPRGVRNQSATVGANDNDHSCGICY